jgi:RNA polymerase sigma-70 factor (ECF subfamily)
MSVSEPAPTGRPALKFSVVYRDHVAEITAFFARRSAETQVVADLVSQTFVEAIGSAHTYSGRGTPRAWLFSIARVVYAQHCAERASGRELIDRLGRGSTWEEDEIEGLAERIDAQRRGRELLERAARLPEGERAALELVDLTGLTPTEAARALGITAGAVRVRLFRARTRLRKDDN